MFVANILGPDALVVLLLAVVLLFGAGQLPKLARNVGEASKEFKKIQDSDQHDAAPGERVVSAESDVPRTTHG